MCETECVESDTDGIRLPATLSQQKGLGVSSVSDKEVIDVFFQPCATQLTG